MGRAPCCDKANVKKGPWSPEEDAKLKEYIEKCGTGGNWISLPQKAGLKRCGKSCRLRWLNYLRPNIKHGDFSDEEDRIICNLFANIGSRWSIIAAQLPGRTDNDIKNYWNTKLKKKLMAMAPHSQRKLPPPFPHHATSLGSSHPLSSIYNDLTGTNFLSCYTKALTGFDPISQISSSLLGGNNCTTPTTNLLPAASTSSLLFQAQEGLVGSMQYYNFNSTSQAKENNILVFGSEASCSSNSDSQISYGRGSDHIKQEDHHKGFQGFIEENNSKFFLSYGSINYENSLSQWGSSSDKTIGSFNFGSETLLGYDLEEDVKQQLMSSSNNNCSHISSFLFDENKTVVQDKSSMFY